MKRFIALCLVFAGCTAADDVVLAGWLEAALAGDLASAEEVMTDGLPFPLGKSAAIWIDGAEPFRSYDIAVECRSHGVDTSCMATWRDLWIDGMGAVDTGELTVTGRVEQGTVVSISSVDFASDLRFALNEHAAWLQVNRRAEYEEQCLDDVFARTCSELLVATVGQWQESSGE